MSNEPVQLVFPFVKNDEFTIDAMMKIIPLHPRVEPCYDCNPQLWRMFCAYMKRPHVPSDAWTEMDVYDSLKARSMVKGKNNE